MANKETSHPSRANKSCGLRKTIRPLLPPLLDIVIVFPLCVYDSLVTSTVVNSLDMLLLLLLAQLKSSLQIMLTMLVFSEPPCIVYSILLFNHFYNFSYARKYDAFVTFKVNYQNNAE